MDNSWRFRAASAAVSVSGGALGGGGGGEGGDFSPRIFGSGRIFEEVCDFVCTHTHINTHTHTFAGSWKRSVILVPILLY